MPTSTTVTARALIRESLCQIVQNRRQLLPIMGLIWLVQLPSFFSEEYFLPHDAMILMGLPPGWLSTIPAIIVVLATYIGPAWSAVGWHRLILLDERPGRFLPRWQPRQIVDFLIIWLFLPILIWGGPALAFFLAAGLLRLIHAPHALTQLLALPAIIVAAWLTLRLGPVQVSRAVPRPVTIAQSYHGTAHLTRALWGISFLSILLVFAMGAVGMGIEHLLTDQDGNYQTRSAIFAGGVISEAVNILVFLLAISMFNTIYRHMAPPIYS